MSGSGGNIDPFEWSNERLIQELCTSNRSWSAPPPKRWPDPEFLAAKLEEHDLDGQLLLCYEDYMGPGGFESLCADLGIAKIPHKLSLRVAIRSFQRKSPGYAAWKASQAAGDNNDLTASEATMPPSPPPKKSPSSRLESGAALTPAIQKGDNHARQAVQEPAPVGVGVKDGNWNVIANGTEKEGFQPNLMHVDRLEPPSDTALGQTKKRKRLAPTNISFEPWPHKERPIDNFADPLDTSAAKIGVVSKGLWQESKKGAYLGDWSLTRYALLQDPDPLGPDYNVDTKKDKNGDRDDEEDDNENDSFGWAAPLPIPSGRRLQVHRILHRYFRPNRSSGVRLGRARSAPTNDALAAGATVADDDEVLPALGESDDEGYDTETWEAMEQEARERIEQNSQEGQQKKTKNAPLTVEAFDAVIVDAIRDIETQWTNKKLHKLRRREHQMWTAARRAGSRKYLVDRARKEADRFAQRIDKLVQEMRHVEWRNEKEIRLQAAVLDANIEDRQYALWEARLYSSPTAPRKVTVDGNALRRQPSTSRAIRRKALEGDEEILTSSSSEEDDDPRMKNFIVDDDDNGTLSDGPMDMSDDDTGGSESRSSSRGPEKRETMRHRDESRELQSGTLPRGDAVKGLLGSLKEYFPLGNMAAIVGKGVSYWESGRDVTRLLCTVFSSADREQLARLVDHCTQATNIDDTWNQYCRRAIENGGDTEAPRTSIESDATAFTRYFYIFVTCRDVPLQDFNPTGEGTSDDIARSRGELGEFCVKLRTLAPYFIEPTSKSTLPLPAASAPPPPPAPPALSTAVPRPSNCGTGIEVDIESEDEDDDELNIYAVRPVVEEIEDDTDEDDDDDVLFSHSQKRRMRRIRKDESAQELRDKDQARHQEQENRRKALYESLAQSGTLSQDQTRLIINTAKEKHHGIVYVDEWIGRNIRDHQVEGVRFMWNQIIAPPESRQGCLLAHTMGLGKTMQVITLLVAIAEAAKSPDESIASQIPDDLKESKTLILCPSGLVENWQDELLAWAAQSGALGHTYSITSSMYARHRIGAVRHWAERGGTMVIGYPMLNMLIKEFSDEAVALVEQTPNIVIADEAHSLKNPNSRINQLTRNFRTSARIAMTGSPLANSVDEYHSMINWVAPNYLAAKDEFRATYANPIREGFYRDSTRSQRRHAVKMLKVLKDTVAPKIHRATVASLQGVLPPKYEFIMYLPLTPLQLRVYKTFIDLLTQPGMVAGINSTVQLWNTLVNLTLLLAHPKIFESRLREMKQPRQTGPRSGTLPAPMVDQLLAAVHAQNIDAPEYSSKIMVLMGILDEAKRVGEKVLVFSQSKLVLDYLQTAFQRQARRYQRLDGDTSVSKRQAMVKDFNAGSDEVYLISTTAGGVGLNIHGANRVVIFDFKWNPIHEQQAIGRAYRIGQTRRVVVYWLIMGGTFETVLHDQAVFKTQLASRVVDKKNPQAWADQLRNYTKDPEVVPVVPDTATKYKGLDVVLDALLRPGAPTQERICKVMSTDTFEMEEPEDALTTEELTEAVNMVNMNRMRLRSGGGGPEGGFQVVGAPGMAGSQTTTMQRVERTQVDGARFPPTAADFATSHAMALAGAGSVLPSLVLASQSRQLQQSQQPGSNPVPSMYAYDAFLNQPASVPMQIRTQSTAHTMQPTPVLPAVVPSNGHLDHHDWISEPVPESNIDRPLRPTPAHKQTPVSTPTVPPPGPSSSLAATSEDFVAVLKEALLSGTMDRQQCIWEPRTAELLARRTVDEIVACLPMAKLSGLPEKAQWGRLRSLVTRVPGFAEATVHGAISAKALVMLRSTEDQKLADLVTGALAEIDSMPRAYSLKTMPNACNLFGEQHTAIRILERKLFDRSWTKPAEAKGNFYVARSLAEGAIANITVPITMNITRCAILAFRDPVFASAFVMPTFSHRAWAAMAPNEEADYVRQLHLQHMVEHADEYRKGYLKIKYTADGSTPKPSFMPLPMPLPMLSPMAPPTHATKAEPMDDASGARALTNVPSRPHLMTGSGRSSFSETLGAASPRPAASPPIRAKDPDHLKHHLQRSQIWSHEVHDRGSVGLGRSEGGGPPREDRPRVSSSGAKSRDLLAMREVVERRERKTAAVSVSASVPQTPQRPSPSPSPWMPQAQSQAQSQTPDMPPNTTPNMTQAARSQVHSSRSPPPPPSTHSARSSSGAASPVPDTQGAAFRIRGAPRIDPASQLQRGQQSQNQLERDLLDTDRRQRNAKKDKDKAGGNKPRILPPPSRGPGPQAGDNAQHPFILD
ncbi:hypothetical protein HMPREF1624_06518 [Sporothrix schenckii ATCC 58251]|uniref:Uncharacterized protein n=1 Tax=Sporothrix schenckii (strain ATCC 58251 / de Perez 2211183) TaxID=1391915 RepID=U7PNM4_SPOS1|nr:hypothetical protein HMPREF1624_06518 [Sporothrix schenckii ATCC 58251]